MSHEFRLAAACCIWPRSERRDAAIRAAAAKPIDWDKLLQIAMRQRVAGLVNDGLREAGIEPSAKAKMRLAAEASHIARQSLQLASEAVNLQAAFDGAGVPAVFVKGTALALLAYNNIGVKHAWDIDLLVMPGDVKRASDLLAGAGFQRIMPPPDLPDERFFAWIEIARECIFHNPVRETFVELHWRLSDNQSLLAHITAASPTRLVPVSAGWALRTLQDEDLFAYLCLHGAHHAWARLKWLADLAAWLSSKTREEIERLYRKAKADGVGRAAAQALLLCEQLFALPLPKALSDEMKNDRAMGWLLAIAIKTMTGDRLLGSMQIEFSHFLLANGVKQWFAELRGKSIGWTDFRRLALPRPLYFLYPVLRVPSWLWRRASHAVGYSRHPFG